MTKLNIWQTRVFANGEIGLSGFIEKDAKHRFRDGEYIYTTPIQYRVGNKVITRSGTIYTLGIHASLNSIPIRKKFSHERQE